MLFFIITNMDKDIIQRVQLGVFTSVKVAILDSILDMKEIEPDWIVFTVILLSDFWHWQVQKLFLVFRQIIVVGIVGMVFNQLGKMVGRLFRDAINEDDIPIVAEC